MGLIDEALLVRIIERYVRDLQPATRFVWMELVAFSRIFVNNAMMKRANEGGEGRGGGGRGGRQAIPPPVAK